MRHRRCRVPALHAAWLACQTNRVRVPGGKLRSWLAGTAAASPATFTANTDGGMVHCMMCGREMPAGAVWKEGQSHEHQSIENGRSDRSTAGSLHTTEPEHDSAERARYIL